MCSTHELEAKLTNINSLTNLLSNIGAASLSTISGPESETGITSSTQECIRELKAINIFYFVSVI
jgi:hypothetical protein